MAIYNLSDGKKTETQVKIESAQKRVLQSDLFPKENFKEEREPFLQESNFFSSLAARLFFLLLFWADLIWMVYAVFLLTVFSFLHLCFLGKVSWFEERIAGAVRTCKRSLVCGVSLFVALFSPSFGIMIACTYFMMYDPKGIEEVVPSSLQSQFKEFFT